MFRRIGAVGFCALSFAAVACGEPAGSVEGADTTEAIQDEAKLLLEEPIEIGTLRVYVDAPAGVMILSTNSPTTSASVFEHLDIDSPSEIYQRITGKAAPARLVELEAEFRAANVFDVDATSGNESTTAIPAAGEAVYGLTAGEFKEKYCEDRQVCLLNRTGDGTINSDRRVFYFDQYAYPYRGNIDLILEYQAWGVWRHGVTSTVLEGTVQHQFVTHVGANRWSRGKVREATGDGYHWTLVTDN